MRKRKEERVRNTIEADVDDDDDSKGPNELTSYLNTRSNRVLTRGRIARALGLVVASRGGSRASSRTTSIRAESRA